MALPVITAEKRLVSLRIKTERAKQHIRYLECEVRCFLATKPYVVGTKRDPQTRKPIYYLTEVRDTPLHLSATVGDVLHNLRSALDHLAYQLVEVGRDRPDENTSFPIFNSATEYNSKKTGKIKGMRPDAIKAIDDIKPYQGGNDALWKLYRLNNIDKHRVLLVVGSAFRSLNLGGHLMRRFLEDIRQMWPDAPPMAVPDLFFRPADRLFPLKTGDKLFSDLPDTKVNEQMQFTFDIAFGEPQVVEGEPLIETLQSMANLVDDLIRSFAPVLE